MKRIASEGKRRTKAEALAYISTVKRRFALKRRKYDEFIEVMKDHKRQRISRSRAVKRVKKLLVGHNDLLLGFIKFFPQGYDIRLPRPTSEDAFRFIMKVKARDTSLGQSFFDIIMKDILEENTSFTQLYQKGADVFHKHPDLLYEFTQFLPDPANRTTTGGADEHPCVLSCVACLAQMVQSHLKL